MFGIENKWVALICFFSNKKNEEKFEFPPSTTKT